MRPVFKKTAPLITFVHAPKAAGTTVNSFLRQNFKRGQDHAQNLIDQPKRFSKIVARSDWVSGHIAWNKFDPALHAATHRKIRYFATVRDPIKQVFSHYNWLIEIYHRGPEFYNQHPPNIKEVSEQIRAANNGNAVDIIKILERHQGLFLNLQSRFILGDDIDLTSKEFHMRLGKYEKIYTVSKLEQLYKHLRQDYRNVPDIENQSPHHLDPEVFKTRALRYFLNRTNRGDMDLYNYIIQL